MGGGGRSTPGGGAGARTTGGGRRSERPAEAVLLSERASLGGSGFYCWSGSLKDKLSERLSTYAGGGITFISDNVGDTLGKGPGLGGKNWNAMSLSAFSGSCSSPSSSDKRSKVFRFFA